MEVLMIVVILGQSEWRRYCFWTSVGVYGGETGGYAV